MPEKISHVAREIKPYVIKWIDDTVHRRAGVSLSSAANGSALDDGRIKGVFNVLDYGAVGSGVVEHAVIQAVYTAAGAVNGTVLWPGAGRVYGLGEPIDVPASVTTLIMAGATVRFVQQPTVYHLGTDGTSKSCGLFDFIGINGGRFFNYGTLDANGYHARFNPTGFPSTEGPPGTVGIFANECENIYFWLGRGTRCNSVLSLNNSQRCTVEHGRATGYLTPAIVAAEGIDYCLFNDLRGEQTHEVLDFNSDCDHCEVHNVVGINCLDEVLDINRSSHNLFSNIRITYDPESMDSYQGAWATATVYDAENDEVGDIVLHGGNYYRAILDHTSGASTEPGVGVDYATRWLRFGSDGILLQGSAGTRYSTKVGTGSDHNEFDGVVGNVGANTADALIAIQAGYVTSPAGTGEFTCQYTKLANVTCTQAGRGIFVDIGTNAGVLTIDAVAGLKIENAHFKNITREHLRFEGVTGYPSTGLMIDGWVSEASGNFACIWVENSIDVTIRNIRIPTLGTAQAGILLHICDGALITDFDIAAGPTPHATSDSGILLEDTPNALIGYGFLRNFAGSFGGIALTQSAPGEIHDVLISNMYFAGNTYCVYDSATAMGYVCVEDCIAVGNTNFVRTLAEYTVRNISSDPTTWSDNTAAVILAAATKTTPVDADSLPLIDSAAGNILKRVTWANIKATIKAYYDSVVATLTNKTISGADNTLTNIANASLVNSSVTIGSTNVALGATAATIAGLTLTTPTINGLAADMDAGEDRAIKVERLQARDAEGIGLYDSAGVLIGILTNGGLLRIGPGTPSVELEVVRDGATATQRILSYGTGLLSNLAMYTPRGTLAAPSATLSGDELGAIYFGGWDTALSSGARIAAIAAADWGSAGDATDDPTDLVFYTVPDGSNVLTERMRILSTGAVTIPGVLTASSGIVLGGETLTLYDEGTWTPVITTSGVAPTTLTYTAQSGIFMRVGKELRYKLRIQIDTFTLGPGTGDIRISLPVAVPAGNEYTSRGVLQTTGVDFTTPVGISFAPVTGQSYGNIISTQDNAGLVVEAISALAGGDVINADGSYFTS